MDRLRNEASINKSVFPRRSPFHQRPWMTSLGAAAAGGEGNKGLKGIVAGNVIIVTILYYYVINICINNMCAR